MKRLLLTLTGLAFILSAKAQKSDTLKGMAADTVIFSSVEQPPQFPGGLTEFYKYVAKNIRYPAIAREKRTQGKVILQLVIEKDGSVSHVLVLRSVSPSIDAEAVRVLNGSPKWNPGLQNGAPVRVAYAMPISFKLDDKVYFMKN